MSAAKQAEYWLARSEGSKAGGHSKTWPRWRVRRASAPASWHAEGRRPSARTTTGPGASGENKRAQRVRSRAAARAGGGRAGRAVAGNARARMARMVAPPAIGGRAHIESLHSQGCALIESRRLVSVLCCPFGAVRRDMCAPPLSARGPSVCVCPGWAWLNLKVCDP